jgi:DNA-directed RNA polymerase specialized sigma24 family protein
MSSVIARNRSVLHSHQNQAFFWIRPSDDEGFRADERFVSAAYLKAEDFGRYRRTELTDEAIRADFVEKAVYSASRADRAEPVRDPSAYLFTVYSRLIDAYIAKHNVVSHSAGVDLERKHSLPQPQAQTPTGPESAILREQVLSAMSAEDRWAWERRLAGYEIQEIAAELKISANTLSTRLRRAASEVGRVLRVNRGRE